MIVSFEPYRKKMSANRLFELLSKLPPDAEVEVNAVQNLVITTSNDKYFGFVCFANEELSILDDDDDATPETTVR